MVDKEKVVTRLEEANLSKKRFVDVHEGEKRSTDHTQLEPDSVKGNYGVYAGNGLLYLDVDDEDKLPDAYFDLSDTFNVKTPHSSGDEGHEYFRMDGFDVEDVEDRLGVKNPAPSFGEIRVHNQYVVGPSSQLDSCDRSGCDKCEKPDGGRYRIEHNRPIADITLDELSALMEADEEENGKADTDKDSTDTDGTVESNSDDLDERLELALALDEKLRSLWNGDFRSEGYINDNGEVDRSGAEYALVSKLAYWFGEDKSRISKLMDKCDAPKWKERGSDYRDKTLRAVDEQEEFYEPTEGTSSHGNMGVGVDLYEVEGGYGYITCDDQGNAHVEKVANFVVETDARVEHAENDTRHFKLTVVPKDGEPYQVDVEPKAFNSSDRFENKVVTGFTTRFDGGKETRNDLRELVGLQDAKVLTGTNLMGLHGDEFMTPEGTLTGDGWTDSPETVLVEQETDIERRWSITPEEKADTDDVEEILRLLPQIRDQERFLPVLGWFYASPLKPFFLKWVGEFPLLSVTGDTGSGKTSSLQVLWRAFGMDDDPLSVDATQHAQLTNFSSSHSVPVWFDEYRPANIKDRRVDKFHDYCRKTTKGASEAKGRPDGSTETYRIKSPVVVSGEQQFQDASLVRRSILTSFRTDVTDEGTDTQRSFAKLVGESFKDKDGSLRYPEPKNLGAHAVGYYCWLLKKGEDDLQSVWHDCRSDVEEILTVHDVGGLDSSERTALQVALFGLRLYQSFGQERGVDVPVDAEGVDDKVEDALVHVATNLGDGKGGRRRSHLDDFVEFVGYAAADGYLKEGKHYKLIHDGDVLRFHLSRAYPKVRKYHRDHDLNKNLFEISEYRNRMKDADDGYVEKVGQNTPPISRCVGIYLEEAAEVIDISVSMFKEDEEDTPKIQAPTPLNSVEEGDRVTVTAEVCDEEDHGSVEVEQIGTLEDATGRCDFVVWAHETGGEPVLQPDTCYRLEGARVGEHEDDLQVQVNRSTEVKEVARGTGWVPPEEDDENERLAEDPRLAVVEELQEGDGVGEDELVGCVEERGVDEEHASTAIEQLLERGVIVKNNGLRL
jgi:hypothetical protein